MKRLLVALIPLCLLALDLDAQTTGAVRGRVADTAGVGIPSAVVRVDGTTRAATTNANGDYLITGLMPGTYMMQVTTLLSSDTLEQEVIINAGMNATVDFAVVPVGTPKGSPVVVASQVRSGESLSPMTLPPGVVLQEGVTVIAARVKKVDANITGNVRGLSTDDLLMGTPRSTFGAIAHEAAVKTGDGGFNIRGGRGNETSICRDGFAITDPVTGATSLFPDVAQAGVERTQIVASGFDAEYGDVLSGAIASGLPVDMADRGSSLTDQATGLNLESAYSAGLYQAPIVSSTYVHTAPSVPQADKHKPVREEQPTEQKSIPKPPPVSIYENPFRSASHSPYSTFSIDVDNGSYTNVRGYLSRGQLPPADAVRIEEMINYFEYNYPDPTGHHPFDFHSEVVACPWDGDHLLVRLALQGRDLHPEQAAPSNLVFLIDVSGSMAQPNKLPLLKESIKKLVDVLRPEDRVAIVVYAGAAGLALESTPGSDKKKIREAIDRLAPGGSTAGAAGIKLAYKTARDYFLRDGNNRVILATDGDFNVGVSSEQELVQLIEEERKDGVFLSVLGFGHGNYQDAKMEQLADHGNGNYYYVDRLKEGERVLVNEMGGTLYTIAKDVKLQIKFNPEKVEAYRLIGYENRVMAARDFNDNTKDAGELGAGHQVTALYEVVPTGSTVGYTIDMTKGEEYRLDKDEEIPTLFSGHDLLLARLRYKAPTDSVSKLISHLIQDKRETITSATEATRFATAVAGWGMLLRGSAYHGAISYDDVLSWGKSSMGNDKEGYRQEFLELVEQSKKLTETLESMSVR